MPLAGFAWRKWFHREPCGLGRGGGGRGRRGRSEEEEEEEGCISGCGSGRAHWSCENVSPL